MKLAGMIVVVVLAGLNLALNRLLIFLGLRSLGNAVGRTTKRMCQWVRGVEHG